MRYCAYQERCHQDVRKKLMEFDIEQDRKEEIIAELIRENYLNEERFAISFSGGRFRMKQWGKNRIESELEQRELSTYCIQKALESIDEDDYWHTLNELVASQLEKNKHLDLLLAKDKTLKFCLRKGFEIDLVLQCLRKY